MLDIDKIIIAKTDHLIEVFGFTFDDIEQETDFFDSANDYRDDTEEAAFYSLCDELQYKFNISFYAPPVTEFNDIVTKVLTNNHNNTKQQ